MAISVCQMCLSGNSVVKTLQLPEVKTGQANGQIISVVKPTPSKDTCSRNTAAFCVRFCLRQ